MLRAAVGAAGRSVVSRGGQLTVLARKGSTAEVRPALFYCSHFFLYLKLYYLIF